ncbi:hypothetical protein BUALT_Bualt03G0181200 [Buddleja alternifolia]|uniref:Reverse transcriptase zinc-binding domain-containing protein n=1 Tax=Buddleja alternifolia TaxID=168488 RepID=A0AAV6Y3A7_9LAMI|nr:hypothetical protein BUALT_Bualt03G0181200 [Buddleja alternifolia]
MDAVEKPLCLCCEAVSALCVRLTSSLQQNWWNFIWRARVPNKIQVFGCELCKDILPTRVNLCWHRCNVNDECPCCKGSFESTKHALLSYSFARQAWALSHLPWRIISDWSSNHVAHKFANLVSSFPVGVVISKSIVPLIKIKRNSSPLLSPKDGVVPQMPELNRLRQLFAASLPQRRCCSADAGTESPPPRFSLSIALIRESPPLQSLLRQCYSTARKPFPELDMRLSKL